MAKKQEVQCHLVTPSTNGEINILTWVDESLKPKVGMVIPMKGDSRVWAVKAAYTGTPQEVKG